MIFEFLLAFLVFVNGANAFTLYDPAEPRWKPRSVEVDYDPSACSVDYDLAAILPEALALWNSVEWTSLKLKVGTSISALNMREGTILTFCNTDSPTVAGRGGVNFDSSAAITSGTASINMSIPTGWAIAPTEYKVAVLAHEIGHAIGFGHTDAANALMSTARGQVSDDDRAAMQYLYPRNEVEEGGYFGCGRVRGVRGNSDPRVSLDLLMLVLFGLVGWFSRRKFFFLNTGSLAVFVGLFVSSNTYAAGKIKPTLEPLFSYRYHLEDITYFDETIGQIEAKGFSYGLRGTARYDWISVGLQYETFLKTELQATSKSQTQIMPGTKMSSEVIAAVLGVRARRFGLYYLPGLKVSMIRDTPMGEVKYRRGNWFGVILNYEVLKHLSVGIYYYRWAPEEIQLSYSNYYQPTFDLYNKFVAVDVGLTISAPFEL